MYYVVKCPYEQYCNAERYVFVNLPSSVNLDPQTIPSDLRLCDNMKAVYCPTPQQKTVDEKPFPYVLCQERLNSGKYRWEVVVEGSWYVVVCTEKAVKKRTSNLLPQNGFWIFHCDNRHRLFANNKPTAVSFNVVLSKLGVCVDCKNQTLLFYDADLHLFNSIPKTIFIPLISPGTDDTLPVRTCL